MHQVLYVNEEYEEALKNYTLAVTLEAGCLSCLGLACLELRYWM